MQHNVNQVEFTLSDQDLDALIESGFKQDNI